MTKSYVKKLVVFFEQIGSENRFTVFHDGDDSLVKTSTAMGSIKRFFENRKMADDERTQELNPETSTPTPTLAKEEDQNPRQFVYEIVEQKMEFQCEGEETLADHIKDITLQHGSLLFVTLSRKTEESPKILYTHRKKSGLSSNRFQLVSEFVQEFRRQKS